MKLVRKFTFDPPIRTSDTGHVMKTKIAAFHGAQFTAEREDDELVIYMLSRDLIDNVITTQDANRRADIAAFNARNHRMFGR
jgi:hypothetical protein